MSLISKSYTFTTGATIVAAEHNSNFDTLYNDYDGNVTNANIASGAAIADTKLGQITTAGKVSGASFTGLASIPAGAGVIPTANMNSSNLFQTGMIILWSGSTATIPSGWILCNGNSGAPNLTDRFVLGAGSTFAVGTTGGSATITTANMPAHTHQNNAGGVGGTNATGALVQPGSSPDATQTGSAGSGTAYYQPYYALAYIYKV